MIANQYILLTLPKSGRRKMYKSFYEYCTEQKINYQVQTNKKKVPLLNEIVTVRGVDILKIEAGDKLVEEVLNMISRKEILMILKKEK
jgi:hypothetical protein